MATRNQIRMDENVAENVMGVKKTALEAATKRGPFGDLQNRAVPRAVLGGKDAAKDAKEKLLPSAGIKARAAPSKPTAFGSSIANAKTSAGAAAVMPQGFGAQRKVLTRSNSVRTINATSNAKAVPPLQRHASSNVLLAAQQSKPKMVMTKMLENKVQQVKIINKTKPQTAAVAEKKSADAAPANIVVGLRREDSNLSRRSLSKLKAALTRDGAAITKPALAKTNSSTLAHKPKGCIVAKKAAPNCKPKATAVSAAPAAESKLKIVSVQTHSNKLLADVEDIDAGDKENLVLVSEYVNDIYAYLYTLETAQPIAKDHLAGQEEVYPKMRAVLLDWINEVHLQFHLAAETFQMGVAIVDRYLQAVKDTKRSQLQLVGVTALFVAAKYEELFPPCIADFVYITDNTYTIKQILQMELCIFKALDFDFSRPLPIHFLRRYSKAAKAEDNHHTMSKYFLELLMIEYEFASYKPSEVAAASLLLTLHLLNQQANTARGFNASLWTPTLEYYSRYTAAHLQPIVRKLAAVAREASTAKLKAVYMKYQSSKFHRIATRPELYGELITSIIHSKNI